MTPSKQNSFKVDFIGIGAPKAATSWIFQCLKEHPQICGSQDKETYFFKKEEEYKKGIEHYKSQFSPCLENTIKGEFTADYLLNEKTPFLIKKHFPQVKLIVCLRNPIERAYSNYYYNKSRHKEIHSTFEQAIKQVSQYIDHGFYFKYLKNYLELFPKENILILIYEDINKNPLNFIQSIYCFLETEPNFNPPSLSQKINLTSPEKFLTRWLSGTNFQNTLNFLKRHFLGRQLIRFLKITGLANLILWFKKKTLKKELDKSEKPLPKPSINPETRKYLQKVYQTEITNLEKLIKRDLSFWQ